MSRLIVVVNIKNKIKEKMIKHGKLSSGLLMRNEGIIKSLGLKLLLLHIHFVLGRLNKFCYLLCLSHLIQYLL